MESTLIISNTTPLINFAEIGWMDLLESLFGNITIPPAVVDELNDKAVLFPLAARVTSSHRVSVIKPANQLLVRSLATRIHPGEAECVALAMESPGALLLLDDLSASEVAASSGLPFTGTLGCLMQAKKDGLIQAIEPWLDEFRTKARFWISDRLRSRVLLEAGE